MHRFYIQSGKPVLKEGDFQHAIVVLRLEEGKEIEIIQGFGQRHLAKIGKIDLKTKQAELIIGEKIEESVEPPCKITLIQGIPRMDKLGDIVESCTQLGVSKFVLVYCKRTQGRYPQDRWDKKIHSLGITAKCAAELSAREIVPEIIGPIDFEKAIALSEGTKLIPWELEQSTYIAKSIKGQPSEVTIAIGPEGGLEHSEIELARSNGFIPVTLGPRILRAELAPVVAISQLLSQIEA